MNWNWLKNLSPTHEPVTYLLIALVCYQLFVQKQSLPQDLIQYLIELVLAGGARQLVKPLAKMKDDNASDNVGLDQRPVDLQSDEKPADGSGLRGQDRP